MGKARLSSVQRTMAACRKEGRHVWKVEQWVTFGKPGSPPRPGYPSGVRRDAFEFIDILAIDSDSIVAIQACTSGRKEHYDKIVACKYALPWLEAGGTIELWYWTKKKIKRGGTAVRWTPKIEYIGVDEFERDEHGTQDREGRGQGAPGIEPGDRFKRGQEDRGW